MISRGEVLCLFATNNHAESTNKVSTQETEGSHKKEVVVTCEETGEEGTDWQQEIKCKLQQPVLVGKCREKDNNKIEDQVTEKLRQNY